MGRDTSIPINVLFLPRKKIPILWKNASILPPVKKIPESPINKRLSGISVGHSYSISATISCIHIVRDTSYLVWIFCQIRLIRFVSESFVDDLETFK